MRIAAPGLALLLFLGGPSVGDESAAIVPGDNVVSRLTTLGSDRLSLYVPEPSSLDVRATAPRGLEVSIALEGPGGEAIDVAPWRKGSPGRRPALRGVPLATPGVYTLRVAAETGSGTYRLRTKLRGRKARRVDLGQSTDSSPPFGIPASSVAIDPRGTSFAAKDAQSFALELSSRLGTVVGSQFALEGRVLNVEGALSLTKLPGLRVAARAVAGLEYQSFVHSIELPSGPTVDTSVVRRAPMASATFAPGAGAGPIFAYVTWSARPSGVSTATTAVPEFEAVWMEIGSKRIAGRRITGPGTEFIESVPTGDATAYYDALGLGTPPSEQIHARTHLVTYQPTDTERSAGFTATLLLSASIPSSAELPGFRVVVDAAAILGD